MKILIFSPYLGKHFGGGEKYLLDVARILAKKHQVMIAISEQYKFNHQDLIKIKSKYENFFSFNLAKVRFITTPLSSNKNFINKLLWTKQFDCLYYQTDGSLFFSLAKKNILHIQIPFTDKKNKIVDKLKLLNWQIKNTNSHFTKKIIEENWQTKIDLVHQPMFKLNTVNKKPDLNKKEKIILNVGRFFSHLHSKRQDILVKAFIKLCQNETQIKNHWQLVLIGGVEDRKYAQKIKALAKNYPIKILHQISRKNLENFYKKASIYWHASGYGVNEKTHPEKVEHFGITTGEAMLAACLPLVINKGGQKEILGHKLKNLLWETSEELIKKTSFYIKNKQNLQQLAQQAYLQAKSFNEDKFAQKLWTMID